MKVSWVRAAVTQAIGSRQRITSADESGPELGSPPFTRGHYHLSTQWGL